MNEAREYIRTLRAACKDTERQGKQLDFFDALAISRPSGEQAIYWMLPALRTVQTERDRLMVRLAEMTALVDEYLSIAEGREEDALLDDLEARMRRLLPREERTV